MIRKIHKNNRNKTDTCLEGWGVGDTHFTGSHIGGIHISLGICVRGYTYHCDRGTLRASVSTKRQILVNENSLQNFEQKGVSPPKGSKRRWIGLQALPLPFTLPACFLFVLAIGSGIPKSPN